VHLIVYGCRICGLSFHYSSKACLRGMQIEKSRGDKGSFASFMPALGSSEFNNGFGYPNSSMGGGMRTNFSGFGSGLDTDVYKSKGAFIWPHRENSQCGCSLVTASDFKCVY